MTRARDDKDGSISILLLGLTLIAMVLILGIITVTSAQLARMRLLDVADAAALDAADTVDDRIYIDGIGEAVPLTDDTVWSAAQSYLAARVLPDRMSAWGIASGTGTPDGETAIVVVTGTADLPVLTPVLQSLGGSITITVSSAARANVSVPAVP